jgi:L,D-transpeptidase catalytic domain
MKRVLSRTAVYLLFLYSCKSAQISPDRFGAEPTYIGYIKGGKPYTHPVVSGKKTAQEIEMGFAKMNFGFLYESKEISIQNTSFNYPKNASREIGVKNVPAEEILLYAIALKKYAAENGYDTTYAMLANMGQLSITKRLYLVDLSAMKILNKGLVSHGRGKGTSIFAKQYSNIPGSNCTALGKYKILDPYKGNYGFSYRMGGLDHSNNNALKRNIVLHAMTCIPDRENYAPACVTEGCPAVSNQFLSALQPIIESRKEPMLFWIFDSLLQQAVVESVPPTSKGNDLVVKNK